MSRFAGSWERVNRALVHGKAYVDAFNTLFHDNPPTMVFDLKHDGANGGTGIARATFEKPFNHYLSIELREFFYQLRAALDGAFWEASVIVSSPKPPPDMTRIEFPIGEYAFNKSPLHKMPFPKNLHAFIEAIQPYNIPKFVGTPDAGFMVALNLIHNCARFDRHRHLTVMAALQYKGAGQFTCVPPHSVTFVRPLEANFLENKCEFMEFGIEGWDGIGDPNIHLNGHLDIHIAVKELPVPLGGDIGEYLQMLRTTTAIIIDKFEKSFA